MRTKIGVIAIVLLAPLVIRTDAASSQDSRPDIWIGHWSPDANDRFNDHFYGAYTSFEECRAGALRLIKSALFAARALRESFPQAWRTVFGDRSEPTVGNVECGHRCEARLITASVWAGFPPLLACESTENFRVVYAEIGP